jgi:site-specific DNA recombinase
VTGHTRLVMAATIGLAVAALGRPFLVLAAILVGDSTRLRVAAGGIAVAALVFGSARVAALDRRTLAVGPVRDAVVVVTGQPSGGHGLAAVRGAGETVVLSVPGIVLEEGGIYRVDGRLQPLDAVVRDYYATQGAHLELRATDAVRTGRRGGVWGRADALHRAALRRLGVGPSPSAPRALVAGIALGDIGGLPAASKAQLRSSGLYHLVAMDSKGPYSGHVQLDAYTRVSSTRDREDTLISPQLQREAIAAYCARHGHTIAAWHEDLNESGTREDRPQFQAALDRIDRGETGGLIVAKLDRFSRSVLGALKTIQRIEAAGGQLVMLDPQIDTTTAGGRAMLGVLLVFAQLQVDSIRESWDAAQRHAVGRGVHVASRAPTGYARAADGRLAVVPQYGPVVADAYRQRAAGASYSELCALFMAAGVVGPYGSPNWTTGAMSKLLANPVYTGQARSGKHVMEGAHPAIVTEAEWRAAQGVRGVVAAARSTDGALLSGILRCAGCRYVMKPDMLVARGEKLRQYRCRGSHASGRCPSPAAVLARVIEPYVVDQFFTAIGPQGILARPVAIAVAADLQHELDDARMQLERFLEHAEVADPQMFNRGVRAREERVQVALAALDAARPVGPLPEATDLQTLWPEMTTAEQRRLLAAGIDAVMLRRGRDLGTRARVLYAGQMADDFPRRGRRGTIVSYDFP